MDNMDRQALISAKEARAELPSMIAQFDAEQMDYFISCLIRELPSLYDACE